MNALNFGAACAYTRLTIHNNREVPRESTRDQSGRRGCAVRHHVRDGSAMPMSNLAAAASDLTPGQNVRYVCNRYRCWWRPNYYSRPYYGYGGYGGYGYGPSSPHYGSSGL